MPKIVCLSDTHNWREQIIVPEGDILIHAGDRSLEDATDDEVTERHEPLNIDNEAI
jgi:hypothetical protein